MYDIYIYIYICNYCILYFESFVLWIPSCYVAFHHVAPIKFPIEDSQLKDHKAFAPVATLDTRPGPFVQVGRVN